MNSQKMRKKKGVWRIWCTSVQRLKSQVMTFSCWKLVSVEICGLLRGEFQCLLKLRRRCIVSSMSNSKLQNMNKKLRFSSHRTQRKKPVSNLMLSKKLNPRNKSKGTTVTDLRDFEAICNVVKLLRNRKLD